MSIPKVKIQKKYRNRNKEKLRDKKLIYLYGLLPDEYEVLLGQQWGVCAICEKEPIKGVRLDVDHSHSTKKIRGLLCRKCNTGIGLLEDELEPLKKAITYLEATYESEAELVKATR